MGTIAAYSVLIGGVICMLPNLVLAERIFAAGTSEHPQALMRAVYYGEAGKLLLTAALFALAFLLIKPLHVLMLFVGFIAAQAVFWIALIMTRRMA